VVAARGFAAAACVPSVLPTFMTHEPAVYYRENAFESENLLNHRTYSASERDREEFRRSVC